MRDMLKNLPSVPGVYLMKDSGGGIIYVGKYKCLKQRVQSYFYNSKDHSKKVQRLVSNIRDLDYIVTDTEFEAFMLECKLIHELKPFYNKKMRNPLAYCYIVIRTNKGHRRIEITNNPSELKEGICFGPYTANRNTVEKAVRRLQECYKISCNQTSAGTPCLNYSLGLCIGICAGGEAVREYDEIMDRFIALLEGSNLGMREEMELRMRQASETYDFETAAKYRDYISAVDFLLNKEKVISFTQENRNIVVFEHLSEGTIKLFLIKRNQVLFSEMVNIAGSGTEPLYSKIKGEVKKWFTADRFSYSNTSVTCDEIDEAQIIYSYLQGSTCNYLLISEDWLNSKDDSDLDKALSAFLASLLLL